MKKLLVYNVFLLISLLVFYNIAGFDNTEFFFLVGLLFVFQASHFFVLPAVLHLGIAYWLLMFASFLLIFLRAFNPNMLDYWLMWSGILGIEIAVSLAIARLYFLGKIHYASRSKNLQQARLLLQQKDYEGFFFFIEPYTQNSTFYEKLQQNLRENNTDDVFRQRCEVFLNALERNEKIEIPI